ncbi:BREX-1 system adenine-specific DNA-methyltransferase PglX [Marinobacter segnicrescens]|uniref:BREX-1 system adenine-specific DNA-methyltransferase PglX n=1 Tax=Marinobacter segnicrescens TaxID=430453 RepID=UPI003A947B91
MSQQETKDMAKHFYRASAADFMKIPGGPVAYWVSDSLRRVFETSDLLSEHANIKQGLATCNNDLFLRYWYEVSFKKIGFGFSSRESAKNSDKKWFPYNKGGGFRHWYGNQDVVVNWEFDGRDIHKYNKIPMEYSGAPVRAKSFYFREGITYGLISSYGFSARRVFKGAVFDVGGSMVFPDLSPNIVQGLMSSKLAESAVSILNPTLNFQVGDIGKIPVNKEALFSVSEEPIERCINICKSDWDNYEASYDFKVIPFKLVSGLMGQLYKEYCSTCEDQVLDLKSSWEEVNRSILSAYNVKGIEPTVEPKKLTVNSNPIFRYGSDSEDNSSRFQSDTVSEIISYAVGCMMGRYSTDVEGLILANQGDTVENYLRQIPSPRFTPDDDAILPLTDQEWFADDATNRFLEFVRVVWGDEHLQGNLDFVAESLCLHAIKSKRGESALDTIRRYLSTQFYKDHLRTYKKRPIYWLFSSGKHKAFECLVYLHRYNEGTLARMRTEYVIPLSAKLNAYAEKLEQDKEASTSAAETKRLEKDIATLHKQQTELAEFDEKLRHYADQRIGLDLDDGVKVNYGKFGDLLAEVKAVTGEKPQ